MPITPLATIGSNGTSSGTITPPIDTTGASLLVISAAWYPGSTPAPSVSDNKGNTWTPLTLRSTATIAQRVWYCANPTAVGTGHTATVSGFQTYPVVTFSAYAGTATSPFDVENGASATAGTSLATGSVTPAASGSLIVSGWAGMNGTSNPTVGSGLTQTTSQNPVGGVCVAGAAAYLIQTTAAAINPTWTWTGSDHVAASIAVFKPVAAAAVERVQSFLVMPG